MCYDGACNSLFVLQQKLNEIRQWTEKVRQFDPSYATDNGIFYLDCAGVQEYVVPKLGEIYEALCVFIVEESMSLAKAFCSEMKTVLSVSMTADGAVIADMFLKFFIHMNPQRLHVTFGW